MRAAMGWGLLWALSGCDLVLDAPAGDAGVDAGSALHGVYVLTKTTVEPPTHPSVNTNGSGHEVTWEEGKVTYRPFHASGTGGSMVMEFGWTKPPASIAPGAAWPMTASAKVVSVVNPLGWDGTTDLRGPGGSLLPLNASGGSQVRVTQADPAGTVVTKAATGTCPDGKAGFTVHVSAPNGNKDWSVDYWYQYDWQE